LGVGLTAVARKKDGKKRKPGLNERVTTGKERKYELNGARETEHGPQRNGKRQRRGGPKRKKSMERKKKAGGG